MRPHGLRSALSSFGTSLNTAHTIPNSLIVSLSLRSYWTFYLWSSCCISPVDLPPISRDPQNWLGRRVLELYNAQSSLWILLILQIAPSMFEVCIFVKTEIPHHSNFEFVPQSILMNRPLWISCIQLELCLLIASIACLVVPEGLYNRVLPWILSALVAWYPTFRHWVDLSSSSSSLGGQRRVPGVENLHSSVKGLVPLSGQVRIHVYASFPSRKLYTHVFGQLFGREVYALCSSVSRMLRFAFAARQARKLNDWNIWSQSTHRQTYTEPSDRTTEQTTRQGQKHSKSFKLVQTLFDPCYLSHLTSNSSIAKWQTMTENLLAVAAIETLMI